MKYIMGKRVPQVTHPTIRIRFIDWRGFHYVRDNYPQGAVIRVWLGFILVKVMIPNG
jgi:hypothetical protein